MAKVVVVGAGPVGRATTHLLADAGHEVAVVTRSGSGPQRPDVRRVALDARDATALTELTAGAAALLNCANPPYHRWPQEWPPLHAAMLAAAEATGATLAITSNLYGYGPVTGPMTEDLPLAAPGEKGRVRAAMWEEAQALHTAGRIRAVEVRGSDFFGPEVLGAALGDRTVPRVLAGKRVTLMGSLDEPHSWTYVPDVAALLAHVAFDERAWGRPWHVPTAAPRTQREMVTAFAAAAGVPVPPVSVAPAWLLQAVGLAVPSLRGLTETRYQFAAPFVLDSSAATAAFGLTATPLDDAVRATVAWWSEAAVAA